MPSSNPAQSPSTTRAEASVHFSFETIWKSLRTFRPPTTAFDPRGTWSHEYQITSPLFRGDDFTSALIGRLALQRRPRPEGGFELVVRAEQRLESSVTTQVATIQAAEDELGTPRSWTLEITMTDAQGAPLLATRHAGDGRAGSTSNWSLFEAVQRLVPAAEPLSFALLEDLELERGPQRLLPAGEIELPLASGALRLRGLRQFGSGHVPWHYWIDERGRLLFVLSPLRSYTFSA